MGYKMIKTVPTDENIQNPFAVYQSRELKERNRRYQNFKLKWRMGMLL